MTTAPNIAGVREGDLLAGKYRIDRILGAGGMGVVVAAHHTQLDEKVAIKFLLPEMLSNGDAVARFAREARAAVKIKSEHVARVADVGTLENGAPFMVMEYLDGGDLSAWLRQRGALSVENATDFLLQACEAIAEAHSLGIVHRDLKPANLFVVRRPDGALSVKVLDFGISKMRGVGSSVPDVSITKTTTMMGSPLYMSPEQMQSSKDVDARTDIWALGVILYELLSGESPFVGETVPELVARILSMPPAPLRERCPSLPAALESAVLKCLEKDRNRRFASVAEFAQALLPFAPKRSRLSVERISGVLGASGMSLTMTALPPSQDARTPMDRTATSNAWVQTRPPKSRARKTLLVVLALALVLGAGAALFLLFVRPGSGTQAGLASTEPAAAILASSPAPAPEPPALSVAPASPVPVETAEPIVPDPAPEPAAAVAPTARRPRPSPARPAARPEPQRPAVNVTPVPPPPSPAPAPIAPKPTVPARPSPGGAFDDRK